MTDPARAQGLEIGANEQCFCFSLARDFHERRDEGDTEGSDRSVVGGGDKGVTQRESI